MKIIPKFLSGGNFNRFSNRFVTYTSNIRQTSLQPQQVSRVSSRKDDDEESTKGKLTEKDLFTMIEQINALPNERRAIISSLKEMLDDDYLMDTDSSDIRMMYLTALDTISQAKYNSDTFAKIKESLSTKDAFNDPAITTDGKVMVINSDGELGTVTATEYLENHENYLILTNSDLSTMREYSSSFINDYKSFSTLLNAVSTKTFQEYIDAAEKDLKTMEYTREGLFSIENGKVVKGLEVLRKLQLNDLVQAMGSVTADGLYEYKIIDKDDKQSLLALTAYIVSTMPSNIRTWAALKTGLGDEGLKTLVETYLISQSSPSHEFQIDYKGSMEKVSKGSDNKSEEPDMTFLTALQFGYGTGRERRSLNLGGNSEIKVNGSAYGGILDLDQKSLYNINLNDMLMKSGINGITNMQSITFGDNIISSTLFPYIAVENNGGFLTILPCKRFGNRVVPNFDIARKFEEITQDVIEEAGSNATLELRETLLAKKLSEDPETEFLLDMSGKIDWNHFASFFIVDGLASDRNINFITKSDNGSEVSISDANNPFIKITTNQDKINYFKMVTLQEEYDEDDSILPGDWFGNYDTLYQGNIFIPILTNNRLAAILFSGQTIKDGSAMAIQQEYMLTTKGMKNASTNILGL